MRQCPNPACPFRVRHGFAAEFEDHVERCRSCDGAVEHQVAAASNKPLVWAALARLGVTVILVVALVGFARLGVPGLELSAGLGTEPGDELAVALSFGEMSLRPALRWLITAAILVELGALALPAGRSLRRQLEGRRTLGWMTIALALVGLFGDGWIHHGRLVDSTLVLDTGMSSLGMTLLTRAAGLPLLLGLAALNERWGLGHGICVALAALLLGQQLVSLSTAEPQQLALLLVLMAASAVWLGRPARASAIGRAPLAADDPHPSELGLGATIPTSGLIAVELLMLVPLGGEQLVRLHDVYYFGELVVLLSLTAFFAWFFTRPELLTTRWRRAFPRADPAALEREAQAVFRRGLLRSGMLMIVIVLLTHEKLPAVEAVVIAAILIDLARELRLRLSEPELVALPSNLDVPGARALAMALELQRKPAIIQGLHCRSLYHLFGWWLPTRVLVRPEDADAAKQLRAQLLAERPKEEDSLDSPASAGTKKEAPDTFVSGA